MSYKPADMERKLQAIGPLNRFDSNLSDNDELVVSLMTHDTTSFFLFLYIYSSLLLRVIFSLNQREKTVNTNICF